MAALTADITQGTLTGSGTQDTVASADAGSIQETCAILFRNYSGSSVTVKLFVNGTADQNQIAEVALATKESCALNITLGPSDFVKAEASAATSVAWTLTKGILA